MIFYISIFLISILLVLCIPNNKVKNRSVIMFFLLLTLVYGLRDGGGVDDKGFINVFDYALKDIPFDIETSFKVIAKFMNFLGLNYKGLFFFYASLSFLFLYLSMKNFCISKCEWVLMAAGFFALVFISSFTIMRQFLASCMIMYSVVLQMKDRIKKSFIIMFLAYLAHNSSIFCLILSPIFLRKKPISYKAKVFIPCICIVIGFSGVLNSIVSQLVKFIPGDYQMYLSSSSLATHVNGSGGFLNYLLLYIYLLQFLLQYALNSNTYKTYNYRIDIIERGEMLYLSLCFITMSSGWLSRLSISYMPFIACLFITFVYRFIPFEDKQFLTTFITICLLVLFMYSFTKMPQNVANGFIPYKWSLNFGKQSPHVIDEALIKNNKLAY